MALVATPVGHMYSSLLKAAWSSGSAATPESPAIPSASYFDRHADITSIIEAYIAPTDTSNGNDNGPSDEDLALMHAQSFGTVTGAMAKAVGEVRSQGSTDRPANTTCKRQPPCICMAPLIHHISASAWPHSRTVASGRGDTRDVAGEP